MRQKEAIERLLKDNNKTKRWLADKLGYALPTGVSNMLARGNVTLNTLIKICDVLEYEITIQPRRRCGPRPAGQIVIDGGEEEKSLYLSS